MAAFPTTCTITKIGPDGEQRQWTGTLMSVDLVDNDEAVSAGYLLTPKVDLTFSMEGFEASPEVIAFLRGIRWCKCCLDFYRTKGRCRRCVAKP